MEADREGRQFLTLYYLVKSRHTATILYQHLKDLNEVSVTCDNRGLKFLNQKDYDLTIFNINPFKTNFFLLPLNIFKILVLTIKSFIFLKKKRQKY